MEELTTTEFARLNTKEREAYLKQLLDAVSDSEESCVSDSDDEDWFPSAERQDSEISDHEEIVEDRSDEVEVDEDIVLAASKETNNESSKLPTTFVAKDKTILSRTLPIQRKTPTRNILRQKSGPHRKTETLSIIDTFKCIFSIEMVDIIIRHTNKKTIIVYQKYNENNPKKPRVWKNLTPREFYGFLGILIMSGANNSNTDHLTDMWKSSSYPLYRATMGINRFWNIMRFIRFDDANTRAARIKKDKAAPIHDIWTILNANLSSLYNPTECLTIDKQLFPYRGRTRFTQYIPSKPGKYGIKIWWVCDAENLYPLTGHLYTGKSDTDREINQREQVIKDLVAPYKRSGRNISMDNKTIYRYHNKTKSGDDTMDQMLGRYTTCRRTNRWPLAFFYNILDIASLAAYIIYYENNKMIKKKTNQRRLFLRQLSEELSMPVIEDRAQNILVMRHYSTKLAIESMYGRPVNVQCNTASVSGPPLALDSTGRKVVVGTCHMCKKSEFKKRRKTRKSCMTCNKPVCDEHTLKIVNCHECTQ